MQKNYVQGTDTHDDDPVIESNHFFTVDGVPIFLTADEEYTTTVNIRKDENFILANDAMLEEESDDYQREYMNVLSAQQKKYSLRNRDVPISPIQKIK